MEDLEILNLWKAYDQKLEENLNFNRKNAEEILGIKVNSLLSSMKPLKIFTILVGLLWAGFGGLVLMKVALHAPLSVNPFFLLSAALQVLITGIALVLYIYQFVLISQVDMSRPVVETQEHLARLKSSTLWIARILFLQLPLWTTFYLSESMFTSGNSILLIVQGIVTASFTYGAIWLFLNIKFENRDKKWFRIMFEGKEWTPVMQSMELLSQINEYRKL